MRAEDPVSQRDRRRALAAFVLLAPAAAVLAILGTIVVRGRPRDVGMPAPAFELERLDGAGTISSASFEGRPYVLNFWASWCVPCREEAPALVRVVGTGRPDVGFVGVNVLDGREQALRFLDEFGVRYPNVVDRSGFYRELRVTGIPETLFVDRRGTVAGRFVGALDERTLRDLLARLAELRPGELLPISGRGESVSVQ